MKKVSLVALFLLVTQTVNAQTLCSTPPLDNWFGDTVWGIFQFTRNGGGRGFNYEVLSTDGQIVTDWNPPPGVDEVWNYPFQFRYTAIGANIELYAQVISGNASGWRCQFTITSIVHHQFGTPVPQYVKDSARSSRDLNLYAAGLATVASVISPPLLSKALEVLAGTFTINATRMNAFNEDPFDPLYPVAYEASFPGAYDPLSYFGLPWIFDDPFNDGVIAKETNALLWCAGLLEGYGLAVYISANRATSAIQAGDFDSAQMQVNWAQAYLNAYADILLIMSSHYRNIGWELQGYWNVPIPDDPYQNNTSSLFLNAADWMTAEAGGLRP